MREIFDVATFAIVTCFHYPGERLEAAINRLRGALGVVDQIVIALDGVTAEEASLIKLFADSQNKVTVLTMPAPHGVANARNHALRKVSADYVWFVDDDDVWDKTGVVALRSALIDHPDIVLARAKYALDDEGAAARIVDGLDRDDVVFAETALGWLLAGTIHGFLWSKVFRRGTLGSEPFPLLSSQSDVVGVARALAAASKVRVIPDIVYTYVRRPGSITRIAAPRLANLARACDGVLEAARTQTERGHDAGEVAYFRTWFHIEGALRVLARQSDSTMAARRAFAEVVPVARTLPLGAVARFSVARALVLGGARNFPGATVTLTRAAYRLLDLRRELARRRQGRGGCLA